MPAPGRLRLPDAPGGHQRPAGTLPEVRHETPRYGHARGRGQLRLPDAPGGHQRPAGTLPTMRMKLLAAGSVTHPAGHDMPRDHGHHRQLGHDAEEHGMEPHGMHHGDAAGSEQEKHSATPRPIPAATITDRRRHRMGRRHGGHQQADHHREHALEIRGPDHRRPAAAIDWRFTVGDRVKIRLVNEMDSDHPMHHPFHLHGAGRFLVLARDGAPEPNLVWKDTVLVRTGQTVDILFDVTNPGLWMAHCHIAEHMQSGMMFSFTVDRGAAR